MRVFFIVLFVIGVNLHKIEAQIYGLNQYVENIPSGAYFKDTEGELDKYVGIWKGIWEGKILILDLRKVKYKHTHHYQDRISGERKIISADGVIEVDRISNFDERRPEFFGIFSKLKNENQKQLQFYPKDMCNKSATLDIHFLNAEKTEMRLVLKYDPSWNLGDCKHQAYIDQYGDYPINFPKDIVLVKQN